MHISRRGQVPAFEVMEIIKQARARQLSYGDAINLCVGQPSTPAPAAVIAAAHRALDADVLGYSEAVGTYELRVALAARYADEGIEVSPDDVVITTGSSGGLLAAFLAAFDAGDRVAIARPGYPAYRNMLTALGCEVVDLAAGPDTRYQPTVEMLDALPSPPEGLIVASPANPTGTIIDPYKLRRLAHWCDEHGTRLISDEIYHRISFGRPTVSAWASSRSAVAVGSFSKYYSMTGWRLGWLLCPADLHRSVELLLGNVALCPPALPQVAALAAFSPEATAELTGHVRAYEHNRDLVQQHLAAMGVTGHAPADGAFYAWCDVSPLTTDSRRWCADLLDATGVAVTPGTDFDPVDGHRFVRISLSPATALIDEAMGRIAGYVARHPRSEAR